MRDTRAACLIFMYNIFVIESIQINKLKKIEAKAPLKSDLGVVLTISPLRYEEGASGPPGAAATPADARVKRQSEENPLAVVLGNPATMQTKTLFMIGQVLKGLYAAARSREPYSASGVQSAVRLFKGRFWNIFFPAESTLEHFFKWKLDTSD